MAAKIGQELLERNQRLEERVSVLEFQLTSSTDLITQLRHDLTVKTDLLHVYTNDAIEDSSPVEVSAFKKLRLYKYCNCPFRCKAFKNNECSIYSVHNRWCLLKEDQKIEQNIFNGNIGIDHT